MEYLDIEIDLVDIEPPRVFRRFLLKAKGTTLRDLHHAIQDAVGWLDYHLFHFETEAGVEVGQSGVEDEGEKAPRAENVPLMDAFTLATNQTLIYHYDYGDDWLVRVVNHGEVARRESFFRRLTGGLGAWAPDDSGGQHRFDILRTTFAKRAAKQGLDAEEKEFLEWAGDWTPDFDVAETVMRFDTQRRPPRRGRR
jgi:hypothetical protein